MKKISKRKKVLQDLFCGMCVGFLNGFLGGAGGLVGVPLLRKFKKFSEREAHINSIAVMFFVSLASSTYYIFHLDLKLSVLIFLALGILCGGLVGGILLRKFSNKTLKLIFANLLLFAGIYGLVIWNI